MRSASGAVSRTRNTSRPVSIESPNASRGRTNTASVEPTPSCDPPGASSACRASCASSGRARICSTPATCAGSASRASSPRACVAATTRPSAIASTNTSRPRTSG
ncbi:MAG: hypothetical protein MUE69_14390 [Myxococcota bacterium]|nr:hypothetical protein [Myxococcota bacterium]